MENSHEETLLKMLKKHGDRIQKFADIEEVRAKHQVAGEDLWPQKKALLEKCDKILDDLENLYGERP